MDSQNLLPRLIECCGTYSPLSAMFTSGHVWSNSVVLNVGLIKHQGQVHERSVVKENVALANMTCYGIHIKDYYRKVSTKTTGN